MIMQWRIYNMVYSQISMGNISAVELSTVEENIRHEIFYLKVFSDIIFSCKEYLSKK